MGKHGMVGSVFPATREAEAGAFQIQGQGDFKVLLPSITWFLALVNSQFY